MGFIQYIKDTRNEMNHVAWPTRVQTIVFTILVIAISGLVAVYLGFFDYLFTTGLGRVVEMLPQSAPAPFELGDFQIDTVPLTEEAPAEPTE